MREGGVDVSISMHQASVGTFVPFLENLSGLLDRAADDAKARRIDPQVLVAMRLAPTMYDLAQQVGEANRHATVACALLAGCEPCEFPMGPPDIGGLKSRIVTAVAFIQRSPKDAIEAAADKTVVFTFKNGTTRSFTGRTLLLSFSVPQFFFHVTTAYDILRHAGVDLAKKDFLGPRRVL
jgi:uncharacterized protein